MTEEAPIEGLSFSAFMDLKKSAFRFWRLRIDPDRPKKKETEAMIFGDLFHTLVLEPHRKETKFAIQISKENYPQALDTTDDIKARLEALQVKPKGRKKDDYKEQLRLVDHNPVFWDEILAAWLKENAGKRIVSTDDIKRAEILAGYVRSHPDACRLVHRDGAMTEERIEWTNRMGIPMRGKIDMLVYIPEEEKLIMPDKTEMWGWILIELKSFSNPMEKDLDKIVTEKFSNDMQFVQLAIYGEAIQELKGVKVDWFVTIFAETGDIPHVLVRANKADGLALSQGEQLYYELCRKFMYYHDKHGFKTPWVDDRQNLRLFQDEEFPIWIFN